MLKLDNIDSLILQ